MLEKNLTSPTEVKKTQTKDQKTKMRFSQGTLGAWQFGKAMIFQIATLWYTYQVLNAITAYNRYGYIM